MKISKLANLKIPEYLIISFLIIFSSVIIFQNLGKNALIDWDESIYAGVSREILETGNRLDLHWNKELWFEKPPLYFWLTAGAFKIFGVNEFAARFWSASAGVAGIILVYLFGRDMVDRKVGFISALALLSTVHWVFQARNGTLDVITAAFILLTLYLFTKARRQKRFWPWVGVALGLTFMTKSVVALIPLAVMGIFAVVDIVVVWLGAFGRSSVGQGQALPCRQAGLQLQGIIESIKRTYPFKSLLLAAAGFLITVLPWHVAEYIRHGEAFWNEYFMYHVLARTKGIEGHDHPFFWYHNVVKHLARHWYVVLIPGLALQTYLAIFKKQLRKRAVFLLLWFSLTFLIFSYSTSKIQWYIIPIYPAIALICGYLGAYIFSFFPKILQVVGFAGLTASVPIFLFLIPSYRKLWLLPDYNRDLANAAFAMPAVSQPDDELLIYGISPGPPIFYSRRKVKTINLNMVYGTSANAERFYILGSDSLLEDLEKKGIRGRVEVFGKSGGYVLFGRND